MLHERSAAVQTHDSAPVLFERKQIAPGSAPEIENAVRTWAAKGIQKRL